MIQLSLTNLMRVYHKINLSIALTHADRRMYFLAMSDDGNLHHVHFSIVPAACHSFVLSVHVPKSFRQ